MCIYLHVMVGVWNFGDNVYFKIIHIFFCQFAIFFSKIHVLKAVLNAFLICCTCVLWEKNQSEAEVENTSVTGTLYNHKNFNECIHKFVQNFDIIFA